MLVTNDDDLNKVIAIANVNQAKKLHFLITTKKTSDVKLKLTNDESKSLFDDGQQADFEDTNTESPPPGTIATQKKRTSINGSSKSMNSSNGGLFIPESVDDFALIYLSDSKNNSFVERRISFKWKFIDS